jgi:hypothetical protein
MVKTSSRGERCPRSRLPVGLEFFAAAQRESRYSLLCKDNNLVITFI